jgi:hypothetical protein
MTDKCPWCLAPPCTCKEEANQRLKNFIPIPRSSFSLETLVKYKNNKTPFDLYIDTQIEITLKKKSHTCKPNRNFSAILAALIAEGQKKGIQVRSADGTIYLATTNKSPVSPSPSSSKSPLLQGPPSSPSTSTYQDPNMFKPLAKEYIQND